MTPNIRVHLLAYGSYVCREECSTTPCPDTSIIGWNKGIEVINPASLARLGNYTLFGSPLTNPYIAADGSLEQVLEKVVVYVPKDNPTTLRLRPLALALNLPYSEPGPQRYGTKENMVFYVVKGSLGYHVPVVFRPFHRHAWRHRNIRQAPIRSVRSHRKQRGSGPPVF